MHNFLKFKLKFRGGRVHIISKYWAAEQDIRQCPKLCTRLKGGKPTCWKEMLTDACWKISRRFANVRAQQQVQENSITTCAWSSLGTGSSTVKIFLNLKTMNRWKLSLNDDRHNYPRLEKAYFFLYTDPFLCHWWVIYYKEIQASTLVLTGCENTSRFGWT